ncbi:MAG: tetratricopeptide repeat protein, partial [Nitrospirota bacterium]
LYKKSVDTKMTPTALFYTGNCYYNLNDYDNAIKEYERFTGKFSSDKQILPLVYQKMAAAYLKINQKEKAINALAKLAGIDDGIFKDTAAVIEARMYDESGDKEKALAKYKEIITKYPTSPWSTEASARLAAEEAKTQSGTPENISLTPVPAADSGTSNPPATAAPK